ncbi:MAG: hypothetical protein J6S23_08225 [Clostridia bacterium]|nr:hypothetical protein [Clostridia bacterium]
MSLRNFIVTMFRYAKPTYSITNIDDIRRILYLDRDLGTVYQGSQAAHSGFGKAVPYTHIYDRLAERIWCYLNNNTVETMKSFDDWHSSVCEEFCIECTSRGISIEYGLAQKFLNLALKYCYCFGDADIAEDKDKFKYCHIALDSYTFCPSAGKKTWAYYRNFCGMSRASLPTPFYTEVVNTTIKISDLPAWSNLNKSQYVNIQNEMRRYFLATPITYSRISAYDIHSLAGCSASTVLTPFQSEFFIW